MKPPSNMLTCKNDLFKKNIAIALASVGTRAKGTPAAVPTRSQSYPGGLCPVQKAVQRRCPQHFGSALAIGAAVRTCT